ncbi:hypothetical protein M514_15714 [Trichuris suis]|uniref:Uncharacterized protein n=1 Tax=Trichuris suis TaxID=68888 RepID=A0A085NRB6_9BILA|nr:hypothetical protein M514_15714 [Trichuris suis]
MVLQENPVCRCSEVASEQHETHLRGFSCSSNKFLVRSLYCSFTNTPTAQRCMDVSERVILIVVAKDSLMIPLNNSFCSTHILPSVCLTSHCQIAKPEIASSLEQLEFEFT